MKTYDPAVRRLIDRIADRQHEINRDIPTATAGMITEMVRAGYHKTEAERMLSAYYFDPKARFHW